MSTPDLTERQEVSASDQARRLRNGLISVAVLLAVLVGLLLAVPGLRGVGRVVADMSPGWVAAAVVLEIISCAGFVVIFLGVFERLPVVFGARVALSEMAFGAAVSLGGAGSIAVGAWLMHERRVETREIASRSAVLFLLTSAINLITLAVFGFGMGAGILAGPQRPLLTLIPAVLSVALFCFFLAIPRLTEPGRGAAGASPGRSGRRRRRSARPGARCFAPTGTCSAPWHTCGATSRSCGPAFGRSGMRRQSP